jgi:lipopolysaccharide/colanic/teichoic acid biosynthesis glycosyltransferase
MKKSWIPKIETIELKRILDALSALLLLFLCLPVMLLTALAVRIAMGSPVLIRQIRPGLHARPFAFLKFRSMTEARNEMGELLPDAERMTPFGTWLRRSSLDELPQLINVLKGDMSLVPAGRRSMGAMQSRGSPGLNWISGMWRTAICCSI